MNLFFLSFKSIISRPLSTFLSWLLLSFGVTIVVLILLASEQLQREINKNASGVDLVVGAKGSPLQLILANIFHVDFPTGNIDLKDAAEVAHSRYIEYAIPLSLGDSYRGFRIVGTTKVYPDLYGAELQSGTWMDGHMGAVTGSEAAQELGLQLNSEFESQHGLSEEGDAHGEHPFVVNGIMKPTGTVLDRLILTSISAIWEVHGHEEGEHHHDTDSLVDVPSLDIRVTQEQLDEEQITALLIKYRSPMGAVMLPRAINERANLQSASPAYETARLFSIIGVGVQALRLLGLLIIVISAISVFIALLHSLKDRKYEIAIMRSMGATRMQLFLHILIEGLLITLVGAVSGLVIAHGLIFALSGWIDGFRPEVFYFASEEWLVLAGCLLIGAVASVVPSVLAYKTDISKTLAKG